MAPQSSISPVKRRADALVRLFLRRRRPAHFPGGLSATNRGSASNGRINRIKLAIRIQIEELPEGLFLATSDELPGLVAQGRTVAEALDIARDVARKLIEARRERNGVPNLPTTSDRRDYTIVVAA